MDMKVNRLNGYSAETATHHDATDYGATDYGAAHSEDSDSNRGELASLGIREIVIVDSLFDRYADFVSAASEGVVGLHFCNDGLSALKLARRFRGDIWLVSTELPDMAGFDLLPILLEHVHQGSVDPLLNGPRISLDSLGTGLHAGVFMVSDLYRIEEEQRALACGSAGYLVRPITLDLVKALREPVRSLAEDPSLRGTSLSGTLSPKAGERLA